MSKASAASFADWMFGVWSHLAATTLMLTPVLALLLALEIAFPKERPSMGSRVRAAGFWVAYLVAMSVTFAAVHAVWAAFNPNPLVVLPLDTWFDRVPLLGALAALFIGALIGDFFFYWMHRAQHAWFWRFHAVHHAIEELNAVASYHHVSEEVLRAVFIYVPTAFLVTDIGAMSNLLTELVALQGFYIHSSTRIHLGPIRRLIGDNVFHRIHHSTNPKHFSKNYSGFSPLWDIAFGTAYFPAPGEWPKTGLDAIPEPGTLREYLMRPFGRLLAAPTMVETHP